MNQIETPTPKPKIHLQLTRLLVVTVWWALAPVPAGDVGGWSSVRASRGSRWRVSSGRSKRAMAAAVETGPDLFLSQSAGRDTVAVCGAGTGRRR